MIFKNNYMKYQAWIYNGNYEWNFTEFDTLQEAIEHAARNSYGLDYKITKSVEYTIKEND